MRIALAGPPGGGRTTLFRALAENSAADPGTPLTVHVPDDRLDFLDGVWKPRKKVHASVVFTDTPSPAFSARSLSDLREASVLALVLDNFARGAPAQDFDSCLSELLLADMAVLEKRRERLQREGRARTHEAQVLDSVHSLLESGRPARTAGLDADSLALLSPYALLTLKPVFVVSNRSDPPVSAEDALEARCREAGATVMPVDAAFELELAELPSEERVEFLRSAGYEEPGLARIVRGAFDALDLIVFLTMGHDEVRAWPLPRGSTAVEAAGRIHSDLARGFIRAQVISYDDFHGTPDQQALKARNRVRLEGRDYVVRDGDILEIRFSV